MSREQILKEFQKLPEKEREILLRDLEKSVQRGSKKNRSLLELAGLGKEIWKGVNPDEYVRNLRREWR
ncbi:MAG: hypothetical protein K2U26_01675 [Cyclobacteriaceae bacterium]|nr:hypothetical protein [Cyclobacteriaceae bacterium]